MHNSGPVPGMLALSVKGAGRRVSYASLIELTLAGLKVINREWAPTQWTWSVRSLLILYSTNVDL